LIWKKDSDVQTVEGRLREIPGIGVALAKMAMRILVREYGLLGGKKSLKELNVKPDFHVKRVFMRVGFTKSPDNNEIIEAALKLFPRDPSKLDAVWDIGKIWCRPTSPNCRECPLKSACPKLLAA
jgi:endonuclease III